MKSTLNPLDALSALLVALLLAAVIAPVLGSPAQGQQFDRVLKVGKAILQYSSDSDGLLPLSMSYDTVGDRWRFRSAVAVPTGWTSTFGRNVPPRIIEERSFVVNAIESYVRNPGEFGDPDFPDDRPLGWTDFVSRSQITPVHLAFNGLLHAFPASAPARPDRLTLLFETYKRNLRGFAFAQPLLCCSNLGPECRFNARGQPQSSGDCIFGHDYGYAWDEIVSTPGFSTYVHGTRMLFLSLNLTATSKEMSGPPLWPQYVENVNDNPWSAYNPSQGYPDGAPFWMTDCTYPGGSKSEKGRVFYAGFFRPDNEFTYTNHECDFGGGW